MEGYIAEIRMFAGSFAPMAWAFCNGSTLAITSNSALFALLGTTYGGDGQTTFALPDFRGRIAVGIGAGNGTTNKNLGDMAGTTSVTLTTANLSTHSHTPVVTAGTGSSSATGTLNVVAASAGNLQNPTGNYLAASRTATSAQYIASGTTSAMNSGAITVSNITAPLPSVSLSAIGGSTAFSVIQPYIGMNFIICVQGIFPSRN